MTSLSEIYKEMSHIVIEQGTLMDRIDINISESKEQATQGRNQIE